VVLFSFFIIVRYSTSNIIFIKNPYLSDKKGYGTVLGALGHVLEKVRKSALQACIREKGYGNE
jgi:hypothetical protein